ncbi:glycosyltransferase family 2 protein [Mariniflexile aquimaris]|uniref:Glycosyltransferase family 2 protein n=1 Tax=Mariniflexile aquimaris TaxID=881009 RepID=A0ABW3BSE0_9FLAO
MKNNLVSIIIPCYNQACFIEEALYSVLEQTYTNWECIIVDDGSTDDTKKIAQYWAEKDSRFIYFEKLNGGLSSARNVGISKSKGTFILLLDSDDKYDFSFISKAINILEKDPNCGAVSCWGQKFIKTKRLEIFKPTGGVIEDFLFQNSAIGTSMLRKLCWQEIGGYDEKMKKGYEDWEFYIRLTQKWKVHVIPEVLFFYRQRDDSMRKIAIKNYDKVIKEYIFKKHKDLYVLHYDETIKHFLEEIEINKCSRLKLLNSLDYKIGHFILKPLRWVKSKIS